MNARNVQTFLDENFELALDPDVFDQETGELSDNYYLKTLVISADAVDIIPNNATANPELQAIADGLVRGVVEHGYSKSEAHTIFALAGAVSLPREVLRENPEQYKYIVTALSSVAMFHLIAADVVEENGEILQHNVPVPDEEAEFLAGLEDAGFTQIAPGVWEITDEQER